MVQHWMMQSGEVQNEISCSLRLKKLLENIRFRAEQQVRCPLRSYSDRICHFSVPPLSSKRVLLLRSHDEEPKEFLDKS